MVTEIQTLGFIVSHNSLRPDAKKIDMLQKATPPKDRTDLRAFLALLQQFISMF
jgi:type III secretory pathway component EscU